MSMPLQRPPLLGATLSDRVLRERGYDPLAALKESFSLGLDVLRLGVYWDEAEQEPDKYDFSAITSLLDICESEKQHVVVTVGMKAPRWPEYYFPAWLQNPQPSDKETQERVILLLQNTLRALCHYKCITHWQVENEPLDPSGTNNLSIPLEFLRHEIEIVRQLDQRPIIVTAWGNSLSARGNQPHLEELGDAVGWDLYYKQFALQSFLGSHYMGPTDSDKKLQTIAQEMTKPLWISELQAEPWEKDEAQYSAENPKSMNPELLEKNFERALKLQPQAILFWGLEYWYQRRQQGDGRMWSMVSDLCRETKGTTQ